MLLLLLPTLTRSVASRSLSKSAAPVIMLMVLMVSMLVVVMVVAVAIVPVARVVVASSVMAAEALLLVVVVATWLLRTVARPKLLKALYLSIPSSSPSNSWMDDLSGCVLLLILFPYLVTVSFPPLNDMCYVTTHPPFFPVTMHISGLGPGRLEKLCFFPFLLWALCFPDSEFPITGLYLVDFSTG